MNCSPHHNSLTVDGMIVLNCEYVLIGAMYLFSPYTHILISINT